MEHARSAGDAERHRKKGLLPLQYHIRMEFCEGEAGHFLASKKVLGMENQGKNLKGFLEFLQACSG